MPPTWRILLAGSLLLLSGCGNSRTPVPSTAAPSAPSGFRTLMLHVAGVRLAAPVNWTVTRQRAPLLVTLASGPAVLAVWRFSRTSPPPIGPRTLATLRIRLIAAIRVRDRSLRVLGTGAVRVAGASAIEIEAIERIAGHRRRVSSTHVYLPGEELVLDAYAPPPVFPSVERSVFEPVRRSLARVEPGTR